MIKKNQDIAVLIPSAGKGSRSKLNYPKTLYKVNKIPILIRILKKVSKYTKYFSVVINQDFDFLYFDVIKKYRINNVEFLYQNQPFGMGDAILKFMDSQNFIDVSDILLIWGDVPFVSRKSLDALIYNHYKYKNYMTILSIYSKNPYTMIIKDQNGFIKKIHETHKSKKKFKFGERDIGVFIFKKELLLELKKYKKVYNNEHNFLYIINYLYRKGLNIKSLPIDNKKESISFNKFQDLYF